MLLFVLII